MADSPFSSATAETRDSKGETSELRKTHSMLGELVSERRELFDNNSNTRTLPGRKVSSKRQIFENKSATIGRDKVNRREKTTTTWKPTQKDQSLDESRVRGNSSSVSRQGMVSAGLGNSRREVFDNVSGPRKGIVRGQSVRERREFFEGPNPPLKRSQSVKSVSEVLKTARNGTVRDKTMTFSELRDIFEDGHPQTARLKSVKSIDYLHESSGKEIVPGGSNKSKERRLDNRKMVNSPWIRINPGENVPQTLRKLEELAISNEETVHNSETTTTTQSSLRTTESTRVSPNSVAALPTRNIPNITITHAENACQNLPQDLTTSRNQPAINQHRLLGDHIYDDGSDRASDNSFVDDFSSDDDDFSSDEDDGIIIKRVHWYNSASGVWVNSSSSSSSDI